MLQSKPQGRALTLSSRNRGCGPPTARCYNQLAHMSWCQYWIEDIDSPCGARCRNEKGYCELHTKLRPAGFEVAVQKKNAAARPEGTNTNPVQNGDVRQPADDPASLKQVGMAKKAAEDNQGWKGKTNQNGLQDRGILKSGSLPGVENEEQAVAGAEQIEVQEPSALGQEPAVHVAINAPKPAFRKKREPNSNPTKKLNKAQKKAEKKTAQEDLNKRGHGKAFKRKKGHK